MHHLPDSLVPLVLAHLPLREAVRARWVCRGWRAVLDGEWPVWKAGEWEGDKEMVWGAVVIRLGWVSDEDRMLDFKVRLSEPVLYEWVRPGGLKREYKEWALRFRFPRRQWHDDSGGWYCGWCFEGRTGNEIHRLPMNASPEAHVLITALLGRVPKGFSGMWPT
jgi:hypothetical protein